MADAVKALTQWRPGRAVVRSEHTREVLPDGARKAISAMAAELDDARARIARLEALLRSLAIEARKG